MGHGCHDCGSPNSCECPGSLGAKLNAEWAANQSEKKVDPVQTRADAMELVYLYAKDILAYWPQFSFKTVPIMMKKMDALKQAIEAVK